MLTFPTWASLYYCHKGIPEPRYAIVQVLSHVFYMLYLTKTMAEGHGNLITKKKKMKKLFVVAVMTLFGFCAHAQQTVILQNSQIQKQATASNEFYINGISSREDIGGVEASVDIERASSSLYRYNCYVCIKNYNNFRVTVLYMAGKDKITGSMVLDPEEEKRSLFGAVETGSVGNISSAMYSVFTITRKL